MSRAARSISVPIVLTMAALALLLTSFPATDDPPNQFANRHVRAAPAAVDVTPTLVQTDDPLTIPGPLVDPTLSLLAGPVDVPLEIRIPALRIKAPVLGVGLTETNAMAAPIGILADDPIWQTVFWYRGGVIPGEIGTATFAGHFDDALGRPAIFAFLDEIRIGDLIIVTDERSGFDIPFIVTETKTYTDAESAEPAVLERIFGIQSFSDLGTQAATDQLSHLTLITCSGDWTTGSFNHRLVVYATRANYPAGLGV